MHFRFQEKNLLDMKACVNAGLLVHCDVKKDFETHTIYDEGTVIFSFSDACIYLY